MSFAAVPVPPQSTSQTNAIQANEGKFVLLKNGDKYGAFKILPKSGVRSILAAVRSDASADYEWFFQPDGSGDFRKDSCKHGRGRVFEKYNRQPTAGGYHLTDVGSILDITCGDIAVEWSHSNWIYFHDSKGGNTAVEIATTNWTKLEEVDVRNTGLKWIGNGTTSAQPKTKERKG